MLDFGLAKALERVSASDTAATALPTITSPAITGVGVLLGTAAYMSPEQARGKPVDKRSDVWAFGCVLYERLTGTRAFTGDGVTDTLGAVMHKDPDWMLLPRGLSSVLATCLKRCLHKDPKQRIPDIATVRLVLAGAFEAEAAASAPRAGVPPRPAWRRFAVPAAALLFGALVARGRYG